MSGPVATDDDRTQSTSGRLPGSERIGLRYHSPQPGGLTVAVTVRGSTGDRVWPAA